MILNEPVENAARKGENADDMSVGEGNTIVSAYTIYRNSKIVLLSPIDILYQNAKLLQIINSLPHSRKFFNDLQERGS